MTLLRMLAVLLVAAAVELTCDDAEGLGSFDPITVLAVLGLWTGVAVACLPVVLHG